MKQECDHYLDAQVFQAVCSGEFGGVFTSFVLLLRLRLQAHDVIKGGQEGQEVHLCLCCFAILEE